jgi:hypothetical protein
MKERTLGSIGKSKQILVPCLEYTAPGSRRLRTQPSISELSKLNKPPRGLKILTIQRGVGL